MIEFLPFRGVRYAAAGDLSTVVAPPYDVIDPAERAALARRDEHASVRLILPEGDDPYRGAAQDLDRWRRDGTLTPDPRPRLYAYRMDFTDGSRPRTTLGVLGALGLPRAVGEGGILPHERTLPKAKSDRLALLRATRANLDPIWALSPAAGLTDLLAPALGRAPLATAAADGVGHALFALDGEDEIGAVTWAVGSAPLVLADGHHRFETAVRYRDEQAGGPGARGSGHVLALVVELTPEQLWVQAIHRVYPDAGGGPAWDADTVRDHLARDCEVTPLGRPDDPAGRARVDEARRSGPAMVWVDRSGRVRLEPRSGPRADLAGRRASPLPDVASTWFEAFVRPAVPAEPAFRHGAHALVDAVRAGDATAAVLLSPPSVAQIRAAAGAGVRMPQKTTFFAPKPRTGMVFRLLDV